MSIPTQGLTDPQRVPYAALRVEWAGGRRD
jgi:hypothetical protein